MKKTKRKASEIPANEQRTIPLHMRHEDVEELDTAVKRARARLDEPKLSRSEWCRRILLKGAAAELSGA